MMMMSQRTCDVKHWRHFHFLGHSSGRYGIDKSLYVWQFCGEREAWKKIWQKKFPINFNLAPSSLIIDVVRGREWTERFSNYLRSYQIDLIFFSFTLTAGLMEKLQSSLKGNWGAKWGLKKNFISFFNKACQSSHSISDHHLLEG